MDCAEVHSSLAFVFLEGESCSLLGYASCLCPPLLILGLILQVGGGQRVGAVFDASADNFSVSASSYRVAKQLYSRLECERAGECRQRLDDMG